MSAGSMPLGSAARFFWSKPTPKLISAYLAILLDARIALGGWGWADALVPVVILALEPFVEWVIHVVVLHWRPRRILGRSVDLYAGREHRRHHADPRNLDILFVPMRLLVIQVPVLIAIGLVVLPTVRIGLTVGAGAMAMLLAYEWTHFLVHSPYVPKSGAYRRLWRAHRLHHYRNEHYWFGVTMHLGDKVFGTFPQKTDVELSATVRSLGVDVDAEVDGRHPVGADRSS